MLKAVVCNMQSRDRLTQLLIFGLCALTVLEHIARQNLKKNGQKPAGVYNSNIKQQAAAIPGPKHSCVFLGTFTKPRYTSQAKNAIALHRSPLFRSKS